MSAEKRYCPACGDKVQTQQVLGEGGLDLACSYCGYLLETQNQGDDYVPAAEEPKPAVADSLLSQMETAADAVMAQQASTQTSAPKLRSIHMVDDSPLIRSLLLDVISGMGLTQETEAFENGSDFVKNFTRQIVENKAPDLVILDLEMPVMDGVTAARVMRALEVQHKTPKRPIIFFSARKCDDNLRTWMDQWAPATYINKGKDMDPERLVTRIDQIVQFVLKKASRTA